VRYRNDLLEVQTRLVYELAGVQVNAVKERQVVIRSKCIDHLLIGTIARCYRNLIFAGEDRYWLCEQLKFGDHGCRFFDCFTSAMRLEVFHVQSVYQTLYLFFFFAHGNLLPYQEQSLTLEIKVYASDTFHSKGRKRCSFLDQVNCQVSCLLLV
jgi:hypothetical protein